MLRLKRKMRSENEKRKSELDRKATKTAFILMFPALILAGIAAYSARSIPVSLLAVVIAIFQFILLKQFIDDYYRKA